MSMHSIPGGSSFWGYNMRDLWLTSSDKLLAWVEKEIAEGRNPSTSEQWEDCIRRMAEADQAEHLGATNSTAGYLAGSLRDEGMNAHVLKIKKEGNQ